MGTNNPHVFICKFFLFRDQEHWVCTSDNACRFHPSPDTPGTTNQTGEAEESSTALLLREYLVSVTDEGNATDEEETLQVHPTARLGSICWPLGSSEDASAWPRTASLQHKWTSPLDTPMISVEKWKTSTLVESSTALWNSCQQTERHSGPHSTSK